MTVKAPRVRRTPPGARRNNRRLAEEDCISMKRMLRGKKRNNAGMSLIEVVVAIAVLSIVILPVLHTFIQSARYNARARVHQQTTAAAQTVMENLKAYSVADICRQFQNNTFKVNGSNVMTAVISGVTFTPEGLPVSEGGDMVFSINKMHYQNSDYDVQVELKDHNSPAAVVESLIYGERSQENAALYAFDAGVDLEALSAILEKVAQKWTECENTAMPELETPLVHFASEVDSGKIDITRQITVQITETNNNYVAKVSCAYAYNVEAYEYRIDSESGETSTFSMSDIYEADLSGDGHEPAKEIFNRSAESNPLKYLTLYYYPAYSYGSGSPMEVTKDCIKIDNTTGTEIQCYIYKQKNLNVSDTTLSTSELKYEVWLELTGAKIYDDNLDTSFGNELVHTPASHIHVDDSKRYRGIGYVAAEGEYPSPGNASPLLPPNTSAQTVENLRMMYDVKISVYNDGGLAGGEDPLNVLEGTIVE